MYVSTSTTMGRFATETISSKASVGVRRPPPPLVLMDVYKITESSGRLATRSFILPIGCPRRSINVNLGSDNGSSSANCQRKACCSSGSPTSTTVERFGTTALADSNMVANESFAVTPVTFGGIWERSIAVSGTATKAIGTSAHWPVRSMMACSSARDPTANMTPIGLSRYFSRMNPDKSARYV